jgi:redox-sensing transcriptional repressor
MNKEKPPGSQHPGATPKATVARLSLYLRHLELLAQKGQETISSNRLGEALEISDAQVRKDLGHFGQFGYPGIGYRIGELRDALRSVIGTNREWSVALVGVGNLGRALFGYGGFRQRGFVVRALFDNDPAKIGTRLGEMTVRPIDRLAESTRELGLQLAILAVPVDAADEAARRVRDAGICGILNFAPVRLAAPKGLHVVSVDLGLELEQLAFQVNRRTSDEAPERTEEAP